MLARRCLSIGPENPVTTGNAIIVKYWVSTDHLPFDDLKGIDEFRDELASAYVSVVSGRAAGAGGITHLLVELTSTFSLSHLAQLILDGVAFDLIKNGAEAFLPLHYPHILVAVQTG